MGAQFYREHLAAGEVDGIPKGSLFAANLLTDAGVQGSAKRYQARQALDEGRAAYAVNLNLAHNAARPYKMKNNPYSRALAQRYHQPNTLGDDTFNNADTFDPVSAGAEFTPGYTAPPVAADAPINFSNQSQTYYTAPTSAIAPPSSGGSSSGWQNVLNSAASANLFSGIGSGLSRLIGGGVTPTVSPSLLSTGGAPSMGMMLLLGGGLLGAGYLLLKKKKRA